MKAAGGEGMRDEDSAQEDEERQKEGSCGISRCIVAVLPRAAEKCIKAILFAAVTPLIMGQEISARGLQ